MTHVTDNSSRFSDWITCSWDAAAAAKSLQSCPTLRSPIDGSPPGYPVPGILQQEHWRGVPLPSPSWDAGTCLFHASISHPHLSFFLFMIDNVLIPPLNVILPPSKSKAHNLPIMGHMSAAYQIFPVPPFPTHAGLYFLVPLWLGGAWFQQMSCGWNWCVQWTASTWWPRVFMPSWMLTDHIWDGQLLSQPGYPCQTHSGHVPWARNKLLLLRVTRI